MKLFTAISLLIVTSAFSVELQPQVLSLLNDKHSKYRLSFTKTTNFKGVLANPDYRSNKLIVLLKNADKYRIERFRVNLKGEVESEPEETITFDGKTLYLHDKRLNALYIGSELNDFYKRHINGIFADSPLTALNNTWVAKSEVKSLIQGVKAAVDGSMEGEYLSNYGKKVKLAIKFDIYEGSGLDLINTPLLFETIKIDYWHYRDGEHYDRVCSYTTKLDSISKLSPEDANFKKYIIPLSKANLVQDFELNAKPEFIK